MLKILGMISRGGGGHLSALRSLASALAGMAEIKEMVPLGETCVQLDPVYRVSRGRANGEQLYNWLAQRGSSRLISGLGQFGARQVRARHAGLVQLLRPAVAAEAPDLVVSTMPFVNGALMQICHGLRLPFLILPSDLDIRYYLTGLEAPCSPYLHLAYAFAEPHLRALSATDQVPAGQQVHLGFPLRPGFEQAVGHAALLAARRVLKLPSGQPVVALMMGGAGGAGALDYVQQLRETTRAPLTLLVFAGRNAQLRARLEAMAPHPHLQMRALGFTAEPVGLLAACDLLISKPGPNSVLEALGLGIPMLLDTSRGCIAWERANVELAVALGAAQEVRHLDALPAQLSAQLARPRNFRALAPPVDFARRVRAWVGACLNGRPASP